MHFGERFNSVTHLVGTVLSVAGLATLVTMGALERDPCGVDACGVEPEAGTLGLDHAGTLARAALVGGRRAGARHETLALLIRARAIPRD